MEEMKNFISKYQGNLKKPWKLLVITFLCIVIAAIFPSTANAFTIWNSSEIIGPAVLQWNSLAISDDGKYISGVVTGGTVTVSLPIYVSTDYGVTFTAKNSRHLWNGIAMSGNGQYQTAVGGGTTAYPNYIYRSTNYGATWTQASSVNSRWQNVGMSKDGQYQTVISTNAGIAPFGIALRSSDFGATWSEVTALYKRSFGGIAVSETGQYQIISDSLKNVEFSSDYGATWTTILNTSNGVVQSVAMSADGMHMTAIEYQGYIWISSDRGTSWSTIAGDKQRWRSVKMSSDGKFQTAVATGNNITTPPWPYYMGVSEDYGQTWTSVMPLGVQWTANAMSADGTQQLVASYVSGTKSRIYKSVATTLNPDKAITAFTIPDQVGATTINESVHAIELIVPYGTNVNALIPTITITGASVSPASLVTQDFTSPVTYTVTATDTTTQNYIVTVAVALNPTKAITAFTIPGQVGETTINESAHTIALTMPYGTDVTALVPTITITGTSVSPLSGVAHDFTSPAPYTATAEDASTQNYIVTVAVALNPAKAITAFTIPGQVGKTTINRCVHTIKLIVPYGTNVNALIPTITITGASVSPTSGAAYNFTTPQTYTVTAADTTTQAHTATVTILTATQTAPDTNGSSTVNSTTPQVVILDPTQAVTVTIENETINASIDVSPLVSNETGTIPQITINSSIANINIPAMNITCANSSWGELIVAPSTFTVPNTATETMTTSTAIEIGFADAKLFCLFDNVVRILLPDQKDKRVGYSQTGTFTEITTICGEDNQTTVDIALDVDKDCKIIVGNDLVVWTKHFTTFATFSSASVSSTPVSSVGGSSGVSGCVLGYKLENGKCVKIKVENQTENKTQSPSQLFDIKLELASATINNTNELSAVITFASFGTVPTFVDLAYSILNSSGKEVYNEKGNVTVTTEQIVRKNFESLNLPDGKYTLVLTTVYGDNVKGEFGQEFSVGKAGVLQYNTQNNCLFMIISGIIIALLIMRQYIEKNST